MTVIAPNAKQRTRPTLIRGRKMVCPRCKTERDILDYQRFGEIEEFAHETAPIYKCPKSRGGCSWVFAPADSVVVGSMATQDGEE